MKVYRVEVPAENGGFCGPYHDAKMAYDSPLADLAVDMGWRHNSDNGRGPAAAYDMPGWLNFHSACVSMQALFAWFGGDLPKLMRLGARVVALDVPDERIVGVEGWQVTFDMNEASTLLEVA